jgi:hypothetical protein
VRLSGARPCAGTPEVAGSAGGAAVVPLGEDAIAALSLGINLVFYWLL